MPSDYGVKPANRRLDYTGGRQAHANQRLNIIYPHIDKPAADYPVLIEFTDFTGWVSSNPLEKVDGTTQSVRQNYLERGFVLVSVQVTSVGDSVSGKGLWHPDGTALPDLNVGVPQPWQDFNRPNAIKDAIMAVQWVKANAATYDLDADDIVIHAVDNAATIAGVVSLFPDWAGTFSGHAQDSESTKAIDVILLQSPNIWFDMSVQGSDTIGGTPFPDLTLEQPYETQVLQYGDANMAYKDNFSILLNESGNATQYIYLHSTGAEAVVTSKYYNQGIPSGEKGTEGERSAWHTYTFKGLGYSGTRLSVDSTVDTDATSGQTYSPAVSTDAVQASGDTTSIDMFISPALLAKFALISSWKPGPVEISLTGSHVDGTLNIVYLVDLPLTGIDLPREDTIPRGVPHPTLFGTHNHTSTTWRVYEAGTSNLHASGNSPDTSIFSYINLIPPGLIVIHIPFVAGDNYEVTCQFTASGDVTWNALSQESNRAFFNAPLAGYHRDNIVNSKKATYNGVGF